MTTTAETAPAPLRVWRIDALSPLLALVGLVLCRLILLPIGWLVWYSITDDAGQLTLSNFTRLAGDPSFALPYLTALGIACGVAAGACGTRCPSPGLSRAPTCRCRARS